MPGSLVSVQGSSIGGAGQGGRTHTYPSAAPSGAFSTSATYSSAPGGVGRSTSAKVHGRINWAEK